MPIARVRARSIVCAALAAASASGCAHGQPRPRLLAAAHAATESSPPVGSGDGAAPRPAEPAHTGPEDTSKKTASFETGAYTDSDHVTVFTPAISGSIENVVDGASIHGSYLVDVVSAASVDIIATASRRWHEVRQAGALSAEYKPGRLGVGFSASVSTEPDYFSYGGAGHLSYDFDEKNTSVFFGYGYGHDTAGRGGTPFSVFSRTLHRGSFVGGIDQVIDQATLASFALGLTIETGDQSKPYRYIPMFSADEAKGVPAGASIDFVNQHHLFERPLEQLPLARRRWALSGELAHRFDGSTLRGSERLYADDWGLKATTTDARWFFDAGDRLRVWPHVRFHAQTPVVFWQRAYVSTAQPGWSLPEFRTGDRELGPLWAVSGGAGMKLYLGGEGDIHSWAVSLAGDLIYTSYTDDLYLTSRTGFLGTLTFDAGEP